MRARTGGVTALVCLTLGVSAETSYAQTFGEAGPYVAVPWVGAWSPLRPIADLSRVELAPPPGMWGMGARPPTTSPLWTVGSAVGIRSGDEPGVGHLGLEGASVSGDYRRPFDPESVGGLLFDGFRWQPLGDRAAAVGRVRAERVLSRAVPRTSTDRLYRSDPFLLVSDQTADVRRISATFEGGYGMRVGGWRTGMLAGLSLEEHSTEPTRIPRTERRSTTALSGALGRSLGRGLEVAADARWLSSNGNLSLITVPGASATLYDFAGYRDPEPVVTSQSVFGRFDEVRANAIGLVASGDHGPVTWHLSAHRERSDTERFRRIDLDAPRTLWTAEGWAVAGAARFPLLGDRVRTWVEAKVTGVDGDAFLPDLVATTFRAEERGATGTATMEYVPADSTWSVVAMVGGRWASRDRRDLISGVDLDLTSRMGVFGLSVERTRTTGSVGANVLVGARSGTLRLPPLGNIDPEIRATVVPELSVYLASTIPTSATAWIRRMVREDLALVVSGSYLRANEDEALLPEGAIGERRMVRVRVGGEWGR